MHKFFLKSLKSFFYLFALPIFFMIGRISKFKKKNYIEIDFSRFGHCFYQIEGALYLSKKKNVDLSNYLFFSSLNYCNSQLKKMVKRVIPINKFNWFFVYLKKSSIFWKKQKNLFLEPNWSLDILLQTEKNINYSKSSFKFSEQEVLKGKELLKKFGLNENDKWVCIHNRDSQFLSKNKINFSYHNYRNFSVQSMKDAAEFFAKNNYYVFRMGKNQTEKFTSNNYKNRIIDYAFNKKKTDFLDIFLLSNCDFYFGGDSGVKSIVLSFLRPCYGVNWSPMFLYSEPGFFMNFNNNLHPWLFIFKRIKSLNTNKKLTLQEILNNKSLYTYNSEIYEKNNLIFIENSISDINNLAEEIINEKNEKRIINDDDVKIKDEFWKIYFKTTGRDKIKNHLPKISPSFLRNNIDLLN